MSSKQAVFKNIDDTLKTVEIALKDLKNDLPERRHASIRNIITFGRTVTFAIQKLKSHVDDFETWYKPKQQEMIANPLFKYFNEVRNQIIHEGKLDTGVSANIAYFSTLFLQYMPKPPNHTGFFMVDENGGSGWTIKNEFGEEEKFYITIGKEALDVQLSLIGLPEDLPYEDTSILNLCTIYYDYLKNLVSEAKLQFS
ncbi:hypothetical protein M2444_005354 [Paenibacillus sp. PastF-3]|uniref:hypothetical protein n=1 Tax=Paenibacillus sp. PastF-3 TaxID=2940626 RepID=UPI0024765489|nr:hypothetical protein [Paenibacillus sp. PastF-3]MDH6373522.1 hypothetical protein [Paenibacillus sp. PastF-3]